MEFGESTLKLSDLSDARLLRRLSMQRSEIQGMHSFNGPKRMALGRVLAKAQPRGKVVVVVLPVSSAYAKEFITPDVRQGFEGVLADALKVVPAANVIRLDQVEGIDSNDHFSDLVHLNSAGRQIATRKFLEVLNGLFHP